MRSASRTVLSMASVGILVASSMLLGCELSPPRPVPMEVVDGVEPAEMRTYQVPTEYQNDLRDMLQDALGRGDDRVGRVTEGPGGTLLVVAPERIQAGIEQILSMGFEAPPAASPITLTYWFLVGRPVDPAQASPFSVAGGADVRRLETVLTQIATAQGPTEFALLDEMQLTSMSQSNAEARSRIARVEQTAARVGNQVVVDFDIVYGGNVFRSRVSLEAGQFLVLGQAGFGGDAVDAFPDATDGDVLTLYCVMTADL